MAKRLDDLNLGPEPVPTGQAMQAQGRQVEIFIAEIEELLEDPAYRFASDTLEGIRDTVRLRQQVSEAQREAVQNIRAGGERQQERPRRGGGSRRYEGWSR
jgi:hypothetical protein